MDGFTQILHSSRGHRRNHMQQIFGDRLRGVDFVRSYWVSQSLLAQGWRDCMARDL